MFAYSEQTEILNLTDNQMLKMAKNLQWFFNPLFVINLEKLIERPKLSTLETLETLEYSKINLSISVLSDFGDSESESVRLCLIVSDSDSRIEIDHR